MKKLVDNREVSDGSYYYLLDWNDRDKKNYILTEFNKSSLCDLNIIEYKKLFTHVTTIEISNWKTENRLLHEEKERERNINKWKETGFLNCLEHGTH